MQGLLRIRAIYAAEDAFKKLPPAKRKLARSEHVRPLMDAFFDWVFYGSDSHAQSPLLSSASSRRAVCTPSAAASFSLVASCRVHSLDPQQYLEVMPLLPYWPPNRYLELAPKYWAAIRSNLDPAELDTWLCSFTVPLIALNFAS